MTTCCAQSNRVSICLTFPSPCLEPIAKLYIPCQAVAPSLCCSFVSERVLRDLHLHKFCMPAGGRPLARALPPPGEKPRAMGTVRFCSMFCSVLGIFCMCPHCGKFFGALRLQRHAPCEVVVLGVLLSTGRPLPGAVRRLHNWRNYLSLD